MDRTWDAVKQTIQPWGIYSVAMLLMIYSYLIQITAGLLTVEIMHDLQLSSTQVALLISGFYYVYPFLQFPAGILIDHFGARNLLALGSVIACIGCFGFSLTDQYWIALLARVALGVGLALDFVAFVYVTATWMSSTWFAVLVSLGETVPIIASTIGELLLSRSLHLVSWRQLFWAAGWISLILSILVVLIIRDKPQSEYIEKPQLQWGTVFKQGWGLCLNTKMLALGFYFGIMFSVLTVFIGVWAHPFFERAQHIDHFEAALLCSVMMMGVAIGLPITSFISQKIENIRPYLILSPLLCAIGFVWIIIHPAMPEVVLAVVLFVMGLIASAFAITYPIVFNLAPIGGKSSYVGFANMLCMLTTPVMIFLIGYVIDQSSQVTRGAGAEVSLVNYQVGMILYPLAMGLCSMLAFSIPNEHRSSPALNA